MLAIPPISCNRSPPPITNDGMKMQEEIKGI